MDRIFKALFIVMIQAGITTDCIIMTRLIQKHKLIICTTLALSDFGAKKFESKTRRVIIKACMGSSAETVNI